MFLEELADVLARERGLLGRGVDLRAAHHEVHGCGGRGTRGAGRVLVEAVARMRSGHRERGEDGGIGGFVVVVAEMNDAARLLVAQRLNRVEFCRLAGGVVAEEEPDGEREEQRDHNRAERREHEVAHER